MTRQPKPTARASLSIYSTRHDIPTKLSFDPQQENNATASRHSSSQSTIQESDETSRRRQSTSSSLSSCETMNNVGFVTIKYTPKVIRATSVLDSMNGSADSSPSNTKAGHLSAKSITEGRTRSSRDRKLTGKALDLAVSGKLYKSAKIARNGLNGRDTREPTREYEDRASDTSSTHESIRASPRVILPVAELDNDDQTPGIETQNQMRSESESYDDPTVGRSMIKLSCGSSPFLAKGISDNDDTIDSTKPEVGNSNKSRSKRRKVGGVMNSVDQSWDDSPWPGEPSIDAEHQDENRISVTPFPARAARRDMRTRNLVVGQTSLRKSMHQAKEVQSDQADKSARQGFKPTLELSKASCSAVIGPGRGCHLQCLDEADILIAFAEHILRVEELVPEAETEVAIHYDQHDTVPLLQALPGLEQLCRCRTHTTTRPATPAVGRVKYHGSI